jgi:outer membrane protein OmpA-like peptidoglycan-associated protein
VKAPGTAPRILIAATVALAAACGPKRVAKPAVATTRTQVVLLPEVDSTVPSSVTVTNGLGNVTLSAPFEATTATGSRAPTPPSKMDEADVRREFGAVIDDLPAAPQHFNLYFRTESSELTEESRALVPTVLRAVKERKAAEVTVIGHTDTTGTSANNYKLGLERANTVRALLLKTGLDASSVEVESHGEADPVRKTPNNTAEPLNRRVEITIR